ncbi:MAG TPA: hypothetical protein VLK24_11950 [Gaiellaceae bacterium]|nr:hypothetical protein [Gaiellaceae bacterium]
MATDYQLVHVNRVGHEHTQPYRSETELTEGDLVRVEGRDWLVDGVDGEQVRLEPARYRLVLRYPDGHVEAGAFRRYGAGAPGVGHTFSTIVDAAHASWEVADDRLQRDELGKPYRELTAERDYSESEDAPGLPEHELEHARDDAVEALAQAAQAGQLVELVALEPGEAPDWDEAGRYIDALILDEIEDDLVVLCGVDTEKDPQETWLETIKARLHEDLRRFREDIESGHDQIEEWDFRDGRIFASIGSFDDQADPDSGHGWLSRLVDSSASAAAGFSRIRKAQLLVD